MPVAVTAGSFLTRPHSVTVRPTVRRHVGRLDVGEDLLRVVAPLATLTIGETDVPGVAHARNVAHPPMRYLRPQP